MIPVVNIVNNLLDKQEDSLDKSTVIQQLLDSTAMLASTSHSISMYRRLNIKQYLNEQYGSLCTTQTPITDMLFGDDVSDKIDNLTKGQKVAALVSNRDFVPGYYSNGHNIARGSSRGGTRGNRRIRGGRNRFLGRGSQRRPRRRPRLGQQPGSGLHQKKNDVALN